MVGEGGRREKLVDLPLQSGGRNKKGAMYAGGKHRPAISQTRCKAAAAATTAAAAATAAAEEKGETNWHFFSLPF